jgi:imidazolonepropionase-like amidohydrolase/Tol biopolymer transport system component
MTGKTRALGIVLGLSLGMLLPGSSLATDSRFRTVELDTSEVTLPALTISPDGQTVVFTLLGHLFSVPVTGGEARQLTAGFAWDSEPVFSPDGRRLAFVSDRDGSSGNLFLLDLESGALTQLTRELLVASPRFSPDGATLAFLRPLEREELPGVPGFFSAALAEVKTVPAGGGAVTTVREAAPHAALFYWPDGRLGWMVPDPEAGGAPWGPRRMLFEALDAGGETAVVGAWQDSFGAVRPTLDGDGICYASDDKLRRYRFGDDTARDLATVADGAGEFALAPGLLGFGDRGQLWLLKGDATAPVPLPFTAHLEAKVRRITQPTWTATTAAHRSPRALLSPLLRTDGRTLIFMAAGFLYEQPAGSGEARRLTRGEAFEADPALSPDGGRLAYAALENGRWELRLLDLGSGEVRTLHRVGGSSWVRFPAWSADGRSVVFQRSDELYDPLVLLRVAVADGAVEELTRLRSSWTTRPQLSADGRTLFFTSRTGKYGALHRLALAPDATPQPLTDLPHHVTDALVSPDGRWLAWRHNTELWLAPFSGEPVDARQARSVVDDCSRSFAFTPDSSALVYASGRRVRRVPLAGGERQELAVRLSWPAPQPPALLIRNLRLLDPQAELVLADHAVLIEGGRFRKVGPQAEVEAPAGATVLDAGGRWALPGLVDSHVHAAWANRMADPDAFIAFGNTSVRDLGGSLDLLNALRDRSENTALPLPRYFYSGEILEGAMPLWGDAFHQLAGEKEARHVIRLMKEWGSELAKVYLTVPWGLQNAMADEAQRQGLPLGGHAISFEEMMRHARQGYATVEHTANLLYDDGRKLMAATGTRWVNTLTCEGGSEIFMREDPPAHLGGPLARRYVTPEKMRTALSGGRLSSYPKEVWESTMRASLDRVFRAWQAGVAVRAGTDVTMAEVFCGLSLHWELEFFTMAGLTPWQALHLGTALGAETVGGEREFGTVAPGQLADLVILDANPLESIRNTVSIWRVVREGRLFDPLTLQQPVAD